MLYSFAIHTDNYPETHLEAYNSSLAGIGYDVVKIGEVSWFPSRAQLIQLRDKINAVIDGLSSIESPGFAETLAAEMKAGTAQFVPPQAPATASASATAVEEDPFKDCPF